MKLGSYNFNNVLYSDLKKFLSKKMEKEKWDFNNAIDSDLSYFVYGKTIQYGFPIGVNFKSVIRRILKKKNNDFIPKYDEVDYNTMFNYTNNYFIGKKCYLKSSNLPYDQPIYLIKNKEYLKKTIHPDNKYFLEEEVKNPLHLDNKNFELRTKILIIRRKNNFFLFHYPTIFVQSGKEITENLILDEIVLNDIHELVFKTGNVLLNYLRNACSIYLLETKKDINLNENIQFELVGIDIVLDKNFKPYLSDIILNPSFGLVKNAKAVQREKISIYTDIIDNFLIPAFNDEEFNLTKSKFHVMTKFKPNINIKHFFSKKTFTINQETINIEDLEYQDKITESGEKMVENLLNMKITELNNDNELLIEKISFIPPEIMFDQNKLIMNDYLLDEIENPIEEEEDTQCEYLNTIHHSDHNILKNVFYLTPWFGAVFLAKKTYQSISRK